MTKEATTALKEDQYEEDDFNSSTVIPDQDYCRLRSNWVLELQSPELMPYETELVSLEMELLEAQEDALDTIQSKDFMDILMSQVYRLDLERTKFILSDLLTTRLNKLEDHVFYNRTQIHRMSDYEVSHLTEFGELLEKHFHRTVLDYIPKEAWRKLDSPEMIDKPDFNRFVFCKVLKDDVEIDDQYHSQGSYLIARYETIQSHVVENQIELLL